MHFKKISLLAAAMLGTSASLQVIASSAQESLNSQDAAADEQTIAIVIAATAFLGGLTEEQRSAVLSTSKMPTSASAGPTSPLAYSSALEFPGATWTRTNG